MERVVVDCSLPLDHKDHVRRVRMSAQEVKQFEAERADAHAQFLAEAERVDGVAKQRQQIEADLAEINDPVVQRVLRGLMEQVP